MPEVIRILLEVGDEEIERAVVVVVAEGNAHCGHGAAARGKRHAADGADFVELAIALVVVEVGVQAVVGDEEIGPTVIVVISGAYGKILALGLEDFGARCVPPGAPGLAWTGIGSSLRDCGRETSGTGSRRGFKLR